MDSEQLDAAILSRFPNRTWDDDTPMPSTSWADGGPLLEEEEIQFTRSSTEIGGWDGKGGIWMAYWSGPGRHDAVRAVGATMLEAGMRAILLKPNVRAETPTPAQKEQR